jgi:hypothetical protein
LARFNGDFKSDIEEVIGVLKENDKNDWVKAVARISWGDNPATLDIRNINMAKMQPMKGISLSDEEADRLTTILLENDYGDLAELEAAVKRKKSRFTVLGNASTAFGGDEETPLHIDINI